MNDIGSHILRQLTTSSHRRFAELNPGGVESSHLTYHLKQLTADGLIRRHSDGYYELTPVGSQFMRRHLVSDLTPLSQPAVTVLLALRNERDEWLLQTKLYYPFVGTRGWPSGYTRTDETLQQSADRLLKESTGAATELTLRGSVYLTIVQAESVVYKNLAHIFTGQLAANLPIQSSDGQPTPQWESITDPHDSQYRLGFSDLWPLITNPPTDHFMREFIAPLPTFISESTE